MSKCTKCGNEIRFMVMGMSDEVCWGCANPETFHMCHTEGCTHMTMREDGDICEACKEVKNMKKE